MNIRELNQREFSPIARRVIVGGLLAIAFLMMASVFSPERTRAGGGVSGAGVGDPLPGIPPKSVDYQSMSNEGSSAAAHEGLRSLGTVEDRGLSIHIYATEGGPRYSIFEKATGRELGALLSAEQVQRGFPDLQLPSMEFNAGSPLMLMLADE